MSEADNSPPLDRRYTITSDTANLAVLRDAVSSAAARVGFAEPTISQLVLAVDEAIGNVIKHGYEGRTDQPIEVSIESIHRESRRGLQIMVCDCGRQVDPETIVGRPLEDIRPGGLGTHIIRNVMDEVEYSIRLPRGMQLRMAKLLAVGDSGPPMPDGDPDADHGSRQPKSKNPKSQEGRVL